MVPSVISPEPWGQPTLHIPAGVGQGQKQLVKQNIVTIGLEQSKEPQLIAGGPKSYMETAALWRWEFLL